MDFEKEVICRPLMAPLLWKVMLRTPSLSKHTFLTNKHNHLKKMRVWVIPKILIEIRNVYKCMDFDIRKAYIMEPS